MRCKACDTILNDWELTRQDKSTGEYLDLCSECLSASNEALGAAYSDEKESEKSS